MNLHHLGRKKRNQEFPCASPTLDDGEEDDDDEEEERDVENHALHLELVPGGVFDLVADASPRSHAHIHVEYVALKENEGSDICFFVCGQFHTWVGTLHWGNTTWDGSMLSQEGQKMEKQN